MFRRILVPYDGSEFSDRALELALDVVREGGADLTVCHVMESTVYVAELAYGSMDSRAALEAREQTGIELLAEATARARQAGVNATTKLLAGDIVPSILEFARSNNADLIVMGSHGRSGWQRALLGSKTEGLVRRCDIPVLIAPCHKHASHAHNDAAAEAYSTLL